MPEVKTNHVEIPGVSGVLDLSETLTNYPTYNNRSGDLKFHVLNDYKPWQELYHEIANYIHGKITTLKLEDDPDYFYRGRVSVSGWESNNDGTWSDITFSYDLEPYKYYKTAYSNTLSLNSTAQTISFSAQDIGTMPIVPSVKITNIGTTKVKIVCTNSELGISSRSREYTSNGTYKLYDLLLSKMSSSNTCKLVLTGSGSATISFRKGDL
jgi:phage-related protein